MIGEQRDLLPLVRDFTYQILRAAWSQADGLNPIFTARVAGIMLRANASDSSGAIIARSECNFLNAVSYPGEIEVSCRGVVVGNSRCGSALYTGHTSLIVVLVQPRGGIPSGKGWRFVCNWECYSSVL